MKRSAPAWKILLRLLIGCVGLGAFSATWASAQCRAGGPQTPTAARFSMNGRVVNAVDNMDVPFVTLRLYGGTQRQMAVSDSEGNFQFLCLEPGMYTVEASKEGFQNAEVQFALLSGSSAGNSDALIRLRPLIRLTTVPKGEVLPARLAKIPEKARNFFEKGVEELHQKKRPEASLEYFRKALEIYPDYDEAFVQLGTAYFRVSRPGEAEQTYRKALQVYPQNARAHIFLSKLLAAQGKLDPAVEELRKATGINDGESLWLAHLDLARILTKQGKAKEAYEHAVRAHDLNKQVEDVHVAYYNACVNLHDYNAGLAELDEVVKLYPNSDTTKKLQALRPMLAKNVAAKKP